MKDNNIGIIVGRFQVPTLHPGHIHLIREVKNWASEVHVFLGVSGKLTSHDPLPFEARKKMISELIPSDHIHELPDVGCWPVWVKELDRRIIEITKRTDDEVYICGSRDSVVQRYKSEGGIFNTHVIPELPGFSGTKSRGELNYVPEWTEEERKFICWYMQQ